MSLARVAGVLLLVGLEATTLPRGRSHPRTELLARTLRACWDGRGQGDGSLTSLPRLGDGGRYLISWRLRLGLERRLWLRLGKCFWLDLGLRLRLLLGLSQELRWWLKLPRWLGLRLNVKLSRELGLGLGLELSRKLGLGLRLRKGLRWT